MKKTKLLKYLEWLSELYKSNGFYKQANAIESLIMKLEVKTIDELLEEITETQTRRRRMENISLCKNCYCRTKDVYKGTIGTIIYCSKCGYTKLKEEIVEIKDRRKLMTSRTSGGNPVSLGLGGQE